jgi:hypothetical protein
MNTKKLICLATIKKPMYYIEILTQEYRTFMRMNLCVLTKHYPR